jgi:hypothetical protein
MEVCSPTGRSSGGALPRTETHEARVPTTSELRAYGEEVSTADAAHTPDGVVVTFRHDEVLVLSEMLVRWNRDWIDRRPEFFDDQAEQRGLWDLCASLEPMIDEAFAPTYSEAVARARAAIRDPD